MKYIVETKLDCVEFATYREAEIFAAENGISPEEIYEEI